MNLKDLLDLSEKLEGRISAYWNFYTVVVIAVGGWLFIKPQLEPVNTWVLAIVLSVFFAANLSVIWYATNNLTALESEIKAVAPSAELKSKEYLNKLLSLSIPNRMKLSAALHLLIDVGVVVVIILYRTPAP